MVVISPIEQARAVQEFGQLPTEKQAFYQHMAGDGSPAWRYWWLDQEIDKCDHQTKEGSDRFCELVDALQDAFLLGGRPD